MTPKEAEEKPVTTMIRSYCKDTDEKHVATSSWNNETTVARKTKQKGKSKNMVNQNMAELFSSQFLQ